MAQYRQPQRYFEKTGQINSAVSYYSMFKFLTCHVLELVQTHQIRSHLAFAEWFEQLHEILPDKRTDCDLY